MSALVLLLLSDADDPRQRCRKGRQLGEVAIGAGLDRTDTALAVGAYVAVGSITVAGSVILYLIDSERAARPLASIKRFMSDYNAVIMMVILLLLGAKLLGNGLGGLWD